MQYLPQRWTGSAPLASSPDLLRLLIAASDLKEGRPGRFCDVTLRQVDTNVTSCQSTVCV